MRLFRHYDPLPPEVTGCVVAVGNFDGVHLGHQAVIAGTLRLARAAKHPCVVLTFEPHPRHFFAPDAPPFRLTPLRIKAHCIEALGVDDLLVLHFDAAFASLSAEAFVDRVLVEGLKARHVVVGYDFVFGHKRMGNAALLAALASEKGFAVSAIEPVRAPNGAVYSSTRIRDLLAAGDPVTAAHLLGRSWEMEGRVVPGDKRASTIGFPTANVEVDRQLLRPARGVYAVRAGIDQGRGTDWHEAVANFGIRPTVGGQVELLEVHLLDRSEDLYGRHLRVALVAYLRAEKKFDGLAALKAQIAEDCQQARGTLARTKATFRAAERPAGELTSEDEPRTSTKP
ncbi:MAG: bifunctional riboflavin kinase/FAD synthetase [Alphaproteobacteria bacterium]